MSKNKVTAPGLSEMKARREKITALTAYTYPMARMLDEAGVDIALVGDSLGRVILGYDSELKVTMEDMIRHTGAVSRGVSRALVVADMPFLSCQVSEEEAVKNAGRLVQEANAEAVKIEGVACLSAIKRIVDIGVPVMGHVGLTPQSVHQLGGLKVQGRDDYNARRIRDEAFALQDAGVFAIVLEAIPANLASEITESLKIPTIGIGAGPDCDGQVLVTHDMLNLYDRLRPSFVKQYADIRQITIDAFKAYCNDVKEGRYPEKK